MLAVKSGTIVFNYEVDYMTYAQDISKWQFENIFVKKLMGKYK